MDKHSNQMSEFTHNILNEYKTCTNTTGTATDDLKSALENIINGIQMESHKITEDNKTIIYYLNSNSPKNQNMSSTTNPSVVEKSDNFLTLHVLKGSIFTDTWGGFSRFDDHYNCSYHTNDRVIELWNISGLNLTACTVGKVYCNWVKLREVMISLKVKSVGLTMFVNLLGHVLLRLPNYLLNNKYIIPMPVTYM